MIMEPPSTNSKRPGVRLLRRPTAQENGESSVQDNMQTSEAASNKLNSKIGAPIIRPVPSRPAITFNQRQRNLEPTRLTNQTRYTKTESLSKPQEVRVIGERIPSPPLDLSSDTQWPSIGGTAVEESARSPGAWPCVSTNQESKGWSTVVKSAPSGKSLIVRKKQSASGTAGESDGNDWSSEGEDMAASGGGGDSNQKQKRKRKKKKKSSVQQPPQENKLDKPLELDIFVYVKQAPVRPVLNRKEAKTPAKDVSAAARNMLDSTAPSTRRGKEREQPKPKKPTNLRKIIEKEKAAKKELREKGLEIPSDFDVTKLPASDIVTATDQSDHSNVPADCGLDTSTGLESVTTPTNQSPAATPTSSPPVTTVLDTSTNNLPETTPTYDEPNPTPNKSPGATPTYDVIQTNQLLEAPPAFCPTHTTTPTLQPSPMEQPLSIATSAVSPNPAATSPAAIVVETMRPIHGKRFREYCSHVVTNEINKATEALLLDLVRFQDRQYHRDPTKARSKRRYVCGLREVYKHLKVGKLKCVIVPPNLDHIQSTGGIDERISSILGLCESQEVQVVYAMSRRRLAIVLKKKFKIGCVGIFSYDGAEGHYRKLRKLVEEATELYQRLAHPQPPREHIEEEDILTSTDPSLHLLSESDNSSDDEDSIPEPKTGNETQKATSGDLWEKWLPQKKETGKSNNDVSNNSPTNQMSQHVNNDITSNSTNQFTTIEGNTATEEVVDTDNFHVLPIEETGTSGSSVMTQQGVAILEPHPLSLRTAMFKLNIHAAEFIPS